MKPRKEVTNMYWFPFRDLVGRRPVRSVAAQSLRGTVRVNGGESGSSRSIDSHTAFAVADWLEIKGRAVEGREDWEERSP